MADSLESRRHRRWGLLIVALAFCWTALNAVVWAIDSAATSKAVGQVRSVVSAQIQFSQRAEGRYAASLECLAGAAGCVDGYSGEPAVASIVERPTGVQFVASGTGDRKTVEKFAFVSDPSGARPWIARATLLDVPPSFCTDASLGIFRVAPGTKLLSPECPGEPISR